MEKYSIIYSLRFEHTYNSGKICRAIDVRINPLSIDLIKRHGLLFKQTAVNEWSLLCVDGNFNTSTSSDELLLDLFLTDPNFMYYTAWDGFEPHVMYDLALPTTNSNATEVIVKNNNEYRLSSSFCTAKLSLNKSTGNALVNTLQFVSKNIYWEYRFIFRNNRDVDFDKLVLCLDTEEDMFDKFKKINNPHEIKTKSKKVLELKEKYGKTLSLKLIEGETKKIMKEYVPFPQIGAFANKEKDTILQICYI